MIMGFCLIGHVQEKAYAAHSDVIMTPHSRAMLVSEYDAADPHHQLRMGLLLDLKPNWHTYWRNPGDAGAAPEMDVTASGALQGKSHEFSWPLPQRLSEGGLMAYAYTGRVLLPQILHFDVPSSQNAAHLGGDVQIHAHAEWVVCADLCVPESGDFTFSLPLLKKGETYEAKKSQEASLFAQADAHMPQNAPFGASILENGQKSAELVLSGEGVDPSLIKDAWFLPYENGIIAQNKAQKIDIQPGKLTLSLEPDALLKPPFWQKSLKGVVVLEDSHHFSSGLVIEARKERVRGPIKEIIPGALHLAPTAATTWVQAGRYLLFAFLGGLILNLMPCVFPVLAMKAVSFMKMSHVGRAEQRASGIFYMIGVMGSFFLLGAMMIVLRLLGSVAGWGFQFQSSAFVLLISWLLFLMALNLLGVFEVTSGALGAQLTGSLGGGAHISAKKPHYQDMMTGFLAVVVATPCTAPFMGVALAGALSGPVLLGLVIFLSMGFGLALPYLLIATLPVVAKSLPKPGLWMERMKQFLAFPLLASCVWLLWVAVLQRGADFVLLGVGGAVVLGFAAWLYGLAQHRAMREGGQKSIIFCKIIAFLCVIGTIFALYLSVSSEGVVLSPKINNISEVENDAGIEAFSEKRLAELRAEHRPVFVDMTASWCITCMVNERVALNRAEVKKAFQERHIITLRGDWTNKDAEISAYLKKQGRDGVPLYIYYPADGEGKQLPQILTISLILNNL